MEDAKKSEIKRGEKGRYLPGNPPGPGRPVGSVSIVGRIKKIFEEEPERFEEYVREVLDDKMMRREVVQQIDGKPVQPIANANGEPFLMQIVKYADDNDSTSVQTETIST